MLKMSKYQLSISTLPLSLQVDQTYSPVDVCFQVVVMEVEFNGDLVPQDWQVLCLIPEAYFDINFLCVRDKAND